VLLPNVEISGLFDRLLDRVGLVRRSKIDRVYNSIYSQLWVLQDEADSLREALLDAVKKGDCKQI
jgi:hypothetical protein